ncbi:MAG: hypothetical protein ACLTSX_06330 [Collinsella sp.]
MSTIHQFRNDYSEGARAGDARGARAARTANRHPVRHRFARCEYAAELIRAACSQPDAFVQFIPGGTAANAVCISAP